MTCYHADEITLRNVAFHIKKKQAIPGCTSTLPRKSRERGAKTYLRMEWPISKPSNKVESHPQDCSAGNQKTSKKILNHKGMPKKNFAGRARLSRKLFAAGSARSKRCKTSCASRGGRDALARCSPPNPRYQREGKTSEDNPKIVNK